MATALTDVNQAGEFDLQPDPRILVMLGEISLEIWRCIAELVDNSIDGFLHAARSGHAIANPRVRISIPTRNDSSAKIQVIDNGPGMTAQDLERAARAGWSGNNMVDNLGLFGMGFNIATARLGLKSTIWTTRAGDDAWHGVEIDFDQLRAQRSFRTAHLTKSKVDPAQHGTTVEISRLKTDQRTELIKGATLRTIRTMLAKTYSAMLRESGAPIRFSLLVNDQALAARRHCVWGAERAGNAGGAEIQALREFDERLSDHIACSHCMTSLNESELVDGACPTCGRSEDLQRRERRVRGWIGVQRFQDVTEFGFDLIRNGRKIEIGDKDLFVFRHEGSEEVEYPIDDQRRRGRIVGEIHMDHAPVDYAKTKFDRNNAAWSEMVRILRGEGPLQPNKAKQLNFSPNLSLLSQHFTAFRRSSPGSSQAGGWARVLVVPDNGEATSMAKRFWDGDAAYQSDGKWWDLVQAADEQRLYGRGGKGPTGGGQDGGSGATDGSGGTNGSGDSGADGHPAGGDAGGDIVDDILGGGSNGGSEGQSSAHPTTPTAPSRERDANLSKTYEASFGAVRMSYEVESFRVAATDPELAPGSPWQLKRADTKNFVFHFLYVGEHPVFASMTMSPLDALLAETAILMHENTRGGASEVSFAKALAPLRDRYAINDSLSKQNLAIEAQGRLKDLANAVVAACPEEERPDMFRDLTEEERSRVTANIMARGGDHTFLDDGGFLRVFPEMLITLLERRPILFLDGTVWDEPHEGIDLKNDQATAEARTMIRDRVKARIADAIWASTLDRSNREPRREELIRASTAIRLIVPDHFEP